MTLAITLGASILIGLVLGMLGGGGSILTVPILITIAGTPPQSAIAISLLVVAITAAAAAIPHARAGRVHWRTAALFGAAGMASSYLGGRVAAFIPPTWLMVAFGVIAFGTAIAMLRGRRPRETRAETTGTLWRALLYGATAGLITGMVGAGGGFLIVPALALLGGLPMAAAVATSLPIIALNAAAGLMGRLGDGGVDWLLGLAVAAVAVIGAIAGAHLAGRVRQDALRTAFGWLVIAVAGLVLIQQVPGTARGWLFTTRAGWATLAITAFVGASLAALRLLRPGRSPHPPAGTSGPG